VEGVKESPLASLPKIDELMRLAESERELASAPRAVLRTAARRVVDDLRARVKSGWSKAQLEAELGDATLRTRLLRAVASDRAHSLAAAVNATGVVLHTNLGRAPLAEAAVAAAAAASQACALEVDRETGERGRRDAAVGALLAELAGAEAATAVNNNAAATLLAVNTFALGRDVVISRGELVEIGGSYRMPEVIERGGARMVEVGTTNRTRIDDYRAAATARTGLLLKVHTSNYRIAGFTEDASLEELVELGRERSIAVVHDLGSGLLRRGLVPGLDGEPTVAGSIAAAADLVLFSGDKLLGGPQAGCIVGRASAVDAARRNPMFRAMRLDKLVLAALEATLRLHREGEASRTVPALERLARPFEAICAAADALAKRIRDARLAGLGEPAVVDASSEAGSGSAPTIQFPTRAVALAPATVSAAELARRLRLSNPAVFARVRDDRVLLDPRTLGPGDDERIVAALATSLRSNAS
jgi:L-seryl-tRNA(Ser) seleniumtransferase